MIEDTGNGHPRDQHSWEYMVTYGEGPRRRPDMRSDLWRGGQRREPEEIPELVPGQYQRYFGKPQKWS